jgi:hypothetical protein
MMMMVLEEGTTLLKHSEVIKLFLTIDFFF